MRKNKIIIFLIGSLLMSQENDIDASYIATFGSVTMNNKVYNQISFTPEIPIGDKIGLGLEFYLYFDENGELYGENWDFSSSEATFKTLVDKIKYFRYGQPIDNIYFRMGSLPEVTFGYGILVNQYSNVMDYPQSRKVGFDLRYTFDDFRLEVIHSDLKEISSPSIFGLRSVIPFSNKFDMGITLVTDLNQRNGLLDSDKDGFPDYLDDFPDDASYWDDLQIVIDELNSICIDDTFCDFDGDTLDDASEIDNLITYYESQIDSSSNIINSKDNVSGISIDFSYNINNRWVIYSEIAHLIGETNNPYDITNILFDDFNNKLGYGIIPFGMIGTLGPNYEVIFTMDIRQSSENFIFQYWNQNYDHNRAIYNSLDNDSFTKESTLYKYGKMKGLNIGITANISKYLKFSMNYAHMMGNKWDSDSNSYVDDDNNSFYTKFEIDSSVIPKVRVAEIFYQQTNTDKPFNFKVNENTLIGFNVGIDISDNMALIFKGRQTYVCEENDCEPVRNTQIETSVYF